MTPDGILGSKNNLTSIREFYGEFTPEIDVIETGLSADPYMLEQIPELAGKTMISNSDCHSAALNRIGREFTMLEVENLSYREIIYALRRNKVAFTAEFNPTEGRYHSTGHRCDRPGHTEAYISHDYNETICPVCKKPFLPGVERRIRQLSGDYHAEHTRKFHHLIPLVEAVSLALGVKSITSAKVVKVMKVILSIWETEIDFWLSPLSEVAEKLGGLIEDDVYRALSRIHEGKFTFDPAGFDGEYGVLRLK
jgi:PHP family Zn ribbon phosphoesterase